MSQHAASHNSEVSFLPLSLLTLRNCNSSLRSEGKYGVMLRGQEVKRRGLELSLEAEKGDGNWMGAGVDVEEWIVFSNTARWLAVV